MAHDLLSLLRVHAAFDEQAGALATQGVEVEHVPPLIDVGNPGRLQVLFEHGGSPDCQRLVATSECSIIREVDGSIYEVLLTLRHFRRVVEANSSKEITQQVRDLLTAASRYPTLRLRVLLAVTTGLRRGDLEAIRIGAIHFDRNTIATRNRKAGRTMPERPIPEAIMTEPSNHVRMIVGISDGWTSQYWRVESHRELGPIPGDSRVSAGAVQGFCWA